MNIYREAEFPRHRHSWVPYIWFGTFVLTLVANTAYASPGSSTGGSSSTGSTGIAGGVSTDAAAYLLAPLMSSLLGAWFTLRQQLNGWLKSLSSSRKWLGMLFFATLAYSLADTQGALLWVGISLMHVLPHKPLEPISPSQNERSSGFLKYAPELCMGFGWVLCQSAWPALSLLVAPLWLLAWTPPSNQRWHGLPLVAASFVVMLLGLRDSLDPVLAQSMAQVSGWLLAGTGASIHLDGTSVLGLRVPIHVTAACAGTVVTLTPFAIGAMLSALWRVPLRRQWQAAIALGCTAALVNLVRIVSVGISSLWWNADQMQLFHDVIGWPMAVLLYAGFALWLRGSLRTRNLR